MRFATLSSTLVTLALTCSVAFADAVAASGGDVAPTKSSYVPVNLAFVPRAELNAGYVRPTNTFSLGIVGGSATSTRGLALSTVVHLNDEHVTGAQVSGVFGQAGGDVTGVQLAGAASWTDGRTRGAQISGAFNYAGGGATGAQIGGAANWAEGVTRGAQIGGVVNVASEVQGVQLAGAVNVAGKVKGLQLGIVNIADEVDGISLGLINIVRRNGLRNVGVWSSDTSLVNVGTRLGTERFYSVLSVGARPVEGEEAQLSVGLGFGTRARLGGGIAIGVEVQSGRLVQGAPWEETDDHLQTLGITATWTPVRGMTLFGGPALNVLYSGTGRGLSEVGAIAGFHRVDLDGDAALELGLGFVGGVQLF